VVAELNSAEVPYCVLSGYDNRAENGSSDVDFMFRPEDMHRIAPLLAQAALQAGARLVQAIPHETSACYFVLAKETGSEVGYLDPDSAGDYRRQGRLWLFAEQILAGRRRYKDWYVPAVSDEFVYYLIKKVLKQSVADFQLRRLRHLYQRDPANCRAAMGKCWCLPTVRAMEKALAAGDVGWFQFAMPRLLAELKASAPVEGAGGRIVQRLREGLRVLRRLLHPAGMCVLVYGGEKEQRAAIADGLLQRLAPAFRRVAGVNVPSGGALPAGLRLAGKVLAARVRSTLVVARLPKAGSLNRDWRFFMARLLLQPDLIFVLAGDDADPLPDADVHVGSALHRSRLVCLSGTLSAEQAVQHAARIVLCRLAKRHERRLSGACEWPVEAKVSMVTETLIEPAGSPSGVR